jgi:ComF family protein
MKHFHEQPLASAMGRLLAHRLRQRLTDAAAELEAGPQVIAPMPTHWVRRLSRGTSAPEVLAEAMAAETGIRLATRLLQCTRRTAKQSLLSPRQRPRNVKGAFRVRPGNELLGLHVVIIDDVVTTGATANEAARILRRAGASCITVAAVSRALPPE